MMETHFTGAGLPLRLFRQTKQIAICCNIRKLCCGERYGKAATKITAGVQCRVELIEPTAETSIADKEMLTMGRNERTV